MKALTLIDKIVVLGSLLITIGLAILIMEVL